MSWDYFDQILYINLPERVDRKTSIKRELQNQNVPPSLITRIEAKPSINGSRGCALSHILALDHAKACGYERFLILEDDVVFLTSAEKTGAYIRQFINFSEKHPWDLFFLGTSPYRTEPTKDPMIKRVLSSSCAHAYALESRYIDTLRASFMKSYELLWNRTSFEESFFFAIDKIWIYLQMQDHWYMGKNTVVRQGKFYSDIEHKLRDRLPNSL